MKTQPIFPQDVSRNAERLTKNLKEKGFSSMSIHPYTDVAGDSLFYVLRLINPNTREKEIRPMRVNQSGEFELKLPEFKEERPLYGLKNLATRKDLTIILCEGEQKADAINSIENGCFYAMSIHGGANSVNKADLSPLAGLTVVLWPDNDPTGRNAMESIARRLKGQGTRIHMIDSTSIGLVEKGDAIDYIAMKCAISKNEVTPELISSLPKDIHETLESDIGELIPEVEWMDKTQECKAEANYRPLVTLIPASSVKPEPIKWLWKDWLATGKLHILAGSPGCGKTNLAMAIASTISTGSNWPDGSPSIEGDVIIWSGEDDPSDTLIPRLIVSGANRDRIFLCGNVVKSKKGENIPFNPLLDMPLLFEAIEKKPDTRLLIIDSIASTISGDSHKNKDVRESLQPIVDLSRQTNCAVLGITHLAKGSKEKALVDRVNGSTAFTAVPRVVWLASKNSNDCERTLVRSKSNIGNDNGGFSYTLDLGQLPDQPTIEASYIKWGRQLEGNPNELMKLAEGLEQTNKQSQTSIAKEWLTELLNTGERPSSEIQNLAKENGISPKPLRDAREQLGIDIRPDRTKEGYLKTHWRLPNEST